MASKPRGPDILGGIDRSPMKPKGSANAWMLANQEAFAAKLKTVKRDWNVIAEVFAAEGLTDGRGRPPKANSLRCAWFRLVKSQSKPAPAVPPAVVAPVAPASGGSLPSSDRHHRTRLTTLTPTKRD